MAAIGKPYMRQRTKPLLVSRIIETSLRQRRAPPTASRSTANAASIESGTAYGKESSFPMQARALRNSRRQSGQRGTGSSVYSPPSNLRWAPRRKDFDRLAVRVVAIQENLAIIVRHPNGIVVGRRIDLGH
jgi:hypothetical protein